MLARLEMKLEKADGISYQMSSAFHGALMELFPKEYGEKLHLSKLHPYTQHLEFREGDWYWIVTALNEEAADQIIGKVLMPLSEITIKKHHLCLKIQEKMYKELSDRELLFLRLFLRLQVRAAFFFILSCNFFMSRYSAINNF